MPIGRRPRRRKTILIAITCWIVVNLHINKVVVCFIWLLKVKDRTRSNPRFLIFEKARRAVMIGTSPMVQEPEIARELAR